MATKPVEYKGLRLRRNEDLNYLELIIDEKNFHDQYSYIISISVMAEYCEYVRPDFVVINKLESDFQLSRNTQQFTKEKIFNVLKSCGVKKVVMLGKESLYQSRYKTIETKNPFMIGFRSVEEMEQWMAGQVGKA